jgi:hypothetical protein
MADISRGEDVDVLALLDAFTHPAGWAQLRRYRHAMGSAEGAGNLPHRFAQATRPIENKGELSHYRCPHLSSQTLMAVPSSYASQA